MKPHFQFHKFTDEFKMNGQPLELVLLNEMNSGVYIATSEVYFPHKDKEYGIMPLCKTHILLRKSIQKSIVALQII